MWYDEPYENDDDLTALLKQHRAKMRVVHEFVSQKLREKLAEKGIDVRLFEMRRELEREIEANEERRVRKKMFRLLGGKKKKKPMRIL